LALSRQAALKFYDLVSEDRRYRTIFPPELDIVVWAPAAESANKISALTGEIFHTAAQRNLHFATIKLPSELLQTHWPEVVFDLPQVLCLRSCLMKPEHLDWLDQIWRILDTVYPTRP
jgi:hypothetical protein